MKKSGFTLTEVLITMAILGVLTVLAISNLTNARPDKDKIMLRKAFNIISSVVSSMTNDPQFSSSGSSGTTPVEDFTNTYVPTGAPYTAVNKFAYIFATSLNNKDLTCTDNKCTFLTTDGLYWEITDNFNNATKTASIMVDVDSSGKSTNTTTGGSPDKFIFTVKASGKIQSSAEASAILNNRKNK